jgi:hypothetical protein
LLPIVVVMRIKLKLKSTLLDLFKLFKVLKSEDAKIDANNSYTLFLSELRTLYSARRFSDVIQMVEEIDIKFGRVANIEENTLALRSSIELSDISSSGSFWRKIAALDVICYDIDLLELTKSLILLNLDVSKPLDYILLSENVRVLLFQVDTPEITSSPKLCALLFELHEYDRRKFQALKHCIEVEINNDKETLDLPISGSLALVIFDLISKKDREVLIDRHFFDFSLEYHWSYLLIGLSYNENWDISLKSSREIVNIVEFVICKNIDSECFTPKTLYDLIIICSACSKRYKNRLIGGIPAALLEYNSIVEYESYCSDLLYIYKSHDNRILNYEPKRNLKIAVCVSGQMRGWRRALDSWKRNVFTGHTIQYFVHTWKDTGSSYPIPPKDERSLPKEMFVQYRDAWNNLGYERMLRKYPNFYNLWNQDEPEVSLDLLKEAFNSKYVVVEDDSLAPFSGMSNAEKMYYKIRECQHMLDRSGEKFDLVIRLRPDFELHDGAKIDFEKIYMESVLNRKIFCDSYARYFFPNIGYCIPDQLAIGTVAAIRSYAKAYDYTLDKHHIFRHFPKEFIAHSNVAYSTLYCGYDIEGIRLSCTLAPLKKPSVLEIKIALEKDSHQRGELYDELSNFY